MTSIIIKFFTGMIALMIAHRIVSTVLVIAFCFLLYKYFSDPKFLTDLFKSVKGLLDGVGGSSEKAKEVAAALF